MKTIIKTGILLSALAVSFIFFYSCDGNNPDPEPGTYSSGVLIVNEGIFQTGTGTISHLSRVSKKLESDIFFKANGKPLGNIGQSMTIYKNKAYIVVNNAGKVEIVNADDFKSIDVLSGLTLPRHCLVVNNQKMYISQWGYSAEEAGIKVIDLQTLAVLKFISTGQGADQMIMSGDKVFICNSGGFSSDTTVGVINTVTDSLITKIPVGYNPNSIALDKDGKIWVLCGGKWKNDWTGLEIPGSLWKIDPNTYGVIMKLDFSSFTSQPSNLVVNKSRSAMFYTYSGGIYPLYVVSPDLNCCALIGKNFYKLGLDPLTDILYASDPGNYTSSGKVFRYQSATGMPIDSFTAGIIPGYFYFNEK